MEETGKKAETKSKKLAKTKKKSKPSVKERVVAFWKGVKAEFRKIIWPSKESLKNQTIAVLVVSVVLSVFIRFFDIACQYVVYQVREESEWKRQSGMLSIPFQVMRIR